MSVLALVVLFTLGIIASIVTGIAVGRARRTGGEGARAAVTPRLDDADFEARLRSELASGHKIEAIKLYRERTGLGLKEAKDAVEAMAFGTGDTLPPRIAPGDALEDEAFAAQLLVLLATDRKIEAIKLYRERTGLGLKEAKDAVDALENGG